MALPTLPAFTGSLATGAPPLTLTDQATILADWTNSTDADGDAVTYTFQYSLDGGANWTHQASSLVPSQYSFTLTGKRETPNAQFRVRANAGGQSTAWVTSRTFAIVRTPPIPYMNTPADGATVTTDIPTLNAYLTKSDGVLWQKAQWQIASNSAFTTNVRLIESGLSQGNAFVTKVVNIADQLTQRTWYIRPRAVSEGGGVSEWGTMINDFGLSIPYGTFVVAHPPAPANLSPTSNQTIVRQGATFPLVWAFTDPSSVDAQTAYQVEVFRQSDMLSIWDSGKVVSSAVKVNAPITSTYDDVLLVWRVTVWDTDDVASTPSALAPFYVRSLPTVDITAPFDEIDTQRVTVQWDFSAASRTQLEFYIQVKDVATGALLYDSGWDWSNTETDTLPALPMVNGQDYEFKVRVRDSAGLEAEDTVVVTAVWVVPGPATYTLSDSSYGGAGFVNLAWTSGQQDPEWIAWRIYRRNVTDDGQWELLHEVDQNASSYTYRDYFAASTYQYEYSLVQVVDRFGTGDIILESAYSIKTVTPVSEDYWVVYSNDPADYSKAFRIYQANADNFTDPYEHTPQHIIGRGRVVQHGDRLGVVGSLTVSLRDIPNGPTARIQRLRWNEFRGERFYAYLRTPFGDFFKFFAGDIAFERLAGVGAREFGSLTIPYSELS